MKPTQTITTIRNAYHPSIGFEVCVATFNGGYVKGQTAMIRDNLGLPEGTTGQVILKFTCVESGDDQTARWECTMP